MLHSFHEKNKKEDENGRTKNQTNRLLSPRIGQNKLNHKGT